MTPHLIVLVGATGVGKTATSLLLAEHFGASIINADSRQLYRDLPIGTAAPTADQLSRVPHYFVGTLSIGDYFNASMFEQSVTALFTPGGALSTSPMTLLSGGSMMYIDAVCNGIDDIPTIDNETRSLLKERLASEGLESLLAELRVLDPSYYQIVDRRNTRRVVHALEVCYMTGRPYSSFRKSEQKPRPFHVIKVGLSRDREELYERINRRVLSMVESGLVEEALRMYPHRNENALNTVGYKEMFDYVDGLCTLDDAITRIQSNTRRYCRKQLTWFKRDKEIVWFHPDDVSGILRHLTPLITP